MGDHLANQHLYYSGRASFRASLDREDLLVVAINHTAPSLDYLLHVIRYDSTHGTTKHFDSLTIEDGNLVYKGRKITLFSQRDPALIDWKSAGAEYIIESTGKFTTLETARKHLHPNGGGKKVVISAPSKDPAVKTIVVGVNRKEYKTDMDVISNASCTTNCLAPLAKVLEQSFGIEYGMMTTVSSALVEFGPELVADPHLIHRYTPRPLLSIFLMATARRAAVSVRWVAFVCERKDELGADLCSRFRCSPRLFYHYPFSSPFFPSTGRGVGSNIIPTTTGAASAVQLVLPELAGKFTGERSSSF